MPPVTATLPSLSEGELIAAIRRRARGASSVLRLGIGDDCAILRPAPGEEIVITTDFSLEGVHFRRDWHPPEAVGHRCLARGLSDLAAMGAKPVAAFLSMAVPEPLAIARRGEPWLTRFLNGFFALGDSCKVPLAGGDTARVPDRACFDIVLLGAVKRGRALLRSAAKPGDAIYVTGALGGSAAELIALQRMPRRFARLTAAASGHPHLYPQPRLAVAAKLAASGLARTAIDISDGPSTDLAHLCEESGLAAEVDAAAIPIHPLALAAARQRRDCSALNLALHGGEDYELLFTAPARAKIPPQIAGVLIHPIGRMVPRKPRQPRMILVDEEGHRSPLEPRGWEHFRLQN